MKRAICISLCLTWLCAIAAPIASAQAFSPLCTVTGTLYDPYGNPAKNIPLLVLKVQKTGAAFVPSQRAVYSDATTGAITFTVPRGSTAYLYCDAFVGSLYLGKAAGVAVAIPDAATATIESLGTAVNVPSQGLTIRDETTPLPTLVSDIDFVGAGVTVTQPSTGKATVTIPGGAANVLTTLGDTLYAGSGGALQRLAGNTSTTRKYYVQTGDGSASAAPAWVQPSYNDLTNVPSSFTPSAHNQAWSTITATPTTLGGYGITDGQPLNSNLTIFGGLSPSNDDILQRKAGAWTNRTPAQFKSDLGLGNVENTALSTWAGSTNLTTFGTVALGTWQGTAIADPYISSAATWNSKQAGNANLSAIAGLTSAADKLPYFTGSGTAALATFTSYGRSLVDDPDAATARSSLGLVIGTDVLAPNGSGASLTALNAANLGSGTVPLARLSGITNTEISGSAAIALSKLSITGTPDGTKFLRDDGSWQAVSSPVGANPSASVGLSAVNGSASTFMRSDGAPALDQSITPTWSGQHIWSLSNAAALAVGPNGNTNPVLRVVTNVASAATGLSITGNAAGSGVTLTVLSSAGAEDIKIVPKGTTGIIHVGQGSLAELRSASGAIVLSDSSGNNLFRAVRDTAWADSVTATDEQFGDTTNKNVVFQAKFGNVISRLQINSALTTFTAGAYTSTPVPTDLVEFVNSSNVKVGAVTTKGAFVSVGVAFASLPGSPADGTIIYCTDGAVTGALDNTLTSGGSGALAVRINGVWRAFIAQN